MEDDDITEELRELLTNYRNAKHCSYQPCRAENLTQSLSGLREELSPLHVSYVFNPDTDLCEDTLTQPALVTLVNAVYTLLHQHKRVTQSVDTLTESNHELKRTNEALNHKIELLASKLQHTERSVREAMSVGLRCSERETQAQSELATTRARLRHCEAQLAAGRHSSRVSSNRAEREMQHLQDKFRDKCGTFLSTHTDRVSPPPFSSVLAPQSQREERREQLRQLDERVRQQAFRHRIDTLKKAVDKIKMNKENIDGLLDKS